jgi:multidrug efflux system outer membrane protein
MAFLTALTPLGAADKPTITLEQALQAAFANNTDLSIAQVELQQALRTQDATSTTYMPSISLSGGISTGGSLIGGTFSGLSASASAGISMSFDGSMLTDSTSRTLAKEGAGISYQRTLSSLEDSVTTSYWKLVANDNAVEEARLSLDQANRQLDTANDRYENGLASQLTVAQARLSVSQAQILLKQLQDSRDLALSSFRALTGISETDFNLEDLPQTIELLLPDAQTLYLDYAGDNTTVRSLQNSVAQAQNDSKTLTLSARGPTVSVSGAWGRAGRIVDATVQSSTGGLSDTGLVSVSVSVPLSSYIPGTSQNLAIKNSEDAVTTARLQLQAGQQELLQSIESAVLNITQQQENLRMMQQNLETTQYSYDLSVEAFEAGLLSNQELETARTSLLNAQIDILSTRLNHLTGCIELASLLETDLTALQSRYSASV